MIGAINITVSKAQKAATAKYEKENYDKILVRFPKGTKEKIKATWETVNGFINKAVAERLEKGVIKITLSKAQRKANDKYIKENYSQVKLSMPKEEAETLDRYCKEKGHTKAGFIRQAIKDKMERNE